MATSPPGRSSTLPPLQRTLGPHRARKQSITRRSREAHHRKQRSRDAKDWTRRGKIDIAGDLLRPTQERPRPYSAEPVARSPWDDLLDAATSVATEEMNEERTPVSQTSRTTSQHPTNTIRFCCTFQSLVCADLICLQVASVARVRTASFTATIPLPAIWPLGVPGIPSSAGIDATFQCSRGP